MRKPKHHHSDRNRIFTPESVAIELIQKIPADPADSWCDCCLGEGVFYRNFPTERKSWFEIDKGKDFLECSERFDWTVTNIPFSQPHAFIFKMAECSVKGFGVLCLANSMTATRLKKLESLGFYPHSQTVLYIKRWGFGYRTDFYVFTRESEESLSVIIHKE